MVVGIFAPEPPIPVGQPTQTVVWLRFSPE
jgi:hypothetical protein